MRVDSIKAVRGDMRIMHNCKEGPPEEYAEKGTEGRVFETRTSLPRDIRGRGKE